MITRVPDSILRAEKALDFDDVTYDEPLSFRFYYTTNNQADIVDTIYLEDGNTPSNLVLDVFNESVDSINFKRADKTNVKLTTVQAGGSEAASRGKCHFQIRWAKDLELTPSNIDIIETKEWQVNYDEDARFFTMYFLHKNGIILSPQDSVEDNIRLNFKNLAANNRAVKTSNVELLYGGVSSLVFRTNRNSEEPITEQISSPKTIYVTNYPSKQQIPLQVRFLGSNTILNDANTENSLSLKIINSPLSNNNRPILKLDSNSKFIISFVKGDHPEALVATDDQLSKVEISASSGWTKEHTANSTEWKFTATNINQLAKGEGIELSITKLKTSSASGLGYLYIDYQNIGNYPDGRLVVAIEKTPLLYKVQNVGIGTKDPAAKLHVNGGDAVISGKVGIGTTTPKKELHVVGDLALGKDENDKKFIFYSRKDNNGDYLQIANDNSSGNFEPNQGITLKRGGNVGIGTTNPKVTLHVVGDLALGADENNKKFFFHSRKGNGDFLHITYDKPDGEYEWDQGITLKRESGNVGISTRDPKAKLHVVGDLVLGKNENNKKFIFYSRNNSNGDFLQITYDKNNGDFEWDQGITLKRGGNVGIGTTTPSAKLDVNGDFHIKGSKPMEYKLYDQRGDNLTIQTDYSTVTWIAVIAGFESYGKDGNTTNGGMRVQPQKGNNNKWEIHCDLGTVTEDRWEVRVLFIKKELCQDKS